MGSGKAPWVWEDGLVHAESGLALQWKVGRCGVPHILVGKSDCFTVTTEAREGQLPPRQSDVLPGVRAAILLLRCLIGWREARRTKGQRWQHPLSNRMLGEIVWHQQILAGKCFSLAAKASIRAPRPAEGPLQVTRPPELFAGHIRTGSWLSPSQWLEQE